MFPVGGTCCCLEVRRVGLGTQPAESCLTASESPYNMAAMWCHVVSQGPASTECADHPAWGATLGLS